MLQSSAGASLIFCLALWEARRIRDRLRGLLREKRWGDEEPPAAPPLDGAARVFWGGKIRALLILIKYYHYWYQNYECWC